MASKFVDRMTVLEDGAEALQARLYWFKNNYDEEDTRPFVMKNPAYEKVRKALSKKFPHGELKKEKGLESFYRESESIINDLRGLYTTMFGVLRFKQNALSLLNQASMILGDVPEFSSISQVVWGVLRLLTKYAQVQIQLASFKDKKLVAALYFNALKLNYSGCGTEMKLNDEQQRFLELSSYLNALEDNAVKLVQDELMSSLTIAGTIRSALVALAPSYLAATNNQNLSTRGAFSLFGLEMSTLTLPPDLRTVLPHLSSEEVQTWVCYGVLCCPLSLCGGLEPNESLMHLVKAVLSSTLVAPVYRDVSILIHDQLQNLFSWFPGKMSGMECVSPQSVTRIRKELHEATVDALVNLGSNRTITRTHILSILENLYLAVSHLPGILGPRFSVILAALSISRKEIISFFRHYPGQIHGLKLQAGVLGSITGNNGKLDFLKFKDSRIGSLIEAHLKLVSLVIRYNDMAKAYSTEALVNTDAITINRLHSQLRSWATTQNKVTDECLCLFNELQTLFEGGENNSQEIAKLCKRLELVLLIDETVPCDEKGRPSAHDVMEWRTHALECISDVQLHVLVREDLFGILSKYASLGTVAFFKTTSEAIFQDLLKDFHTAHQSVSLVHVLRDAPLVLHRFSQEELESVKQAAVKQAGLRLRCAAVKLDRIMSLYFTERHETLTKALQPVVAAKLLKRKYAKRAMEETNGGKGGGPEESQEIRLAASRGSSLKPIKPALEKSKAEQTNTTSFGLEMNTKSFKLKYCNPGIESKSENANSIERLKNIRAALVALATALGRCDTISSASSRLVVVADHLFSPQYIIREVAQDWLSAQLRLSLVNEQLPNTVTRPSEFLASFESAFHVVQIVGLHAGIDTNDVVRAVMFEQSGGLSQHRLGSMDSTPTEALKTAAQSHILAYSQSVSNSGQGGQGNCALRESAGHGAQLSSPRPKKIVSVFADTLAGWLGHFVENLLSPGLDGASSLQNNGCSLNASFNLQQIDFGPKGSLTNPKRINLNTQKAQGVEMHIPNSENEEKDRNMSVERRVGRAGVDATSVTCLLRDGIHLKIIPNRSTSQPNWNFPSGQAFFGSPGIVYSEQYGGFIRMKEPAQQKAKVQAKARMLLQADSDAFPAEQWLCESETNALVKVLGPRGVRVVERSMIAIVASQMKRILVLLRENRQQLREFKSYIESEDGNESNATAKALSVASGIGGCSIITACLITAGNALLTRRLLKKALGKSLQQNAPSLTLAIEHATHQWGSECEFSEVLLRTRGHAHLGFIEAFGEKDSNRIENRVAGKALKEKIDAIGAASGVIPDTNKDFSLQAAIAPILLSDGGLEILDLLPFAVSASMAQDAWKSSDVAPSLDAHVNNVHVIPYSLRCLLSAAYPVSLQLQNMKHDTAQWVENVQKAMMNHLRSGFTLLTEMKIAETSMYKDWPLRSMIMYMDVVVRQSEGIVTYQDLEKNSLPYALIHTATVERYLGKVHGSDTLSSPQISSRRIFRDGSSVLRRADSKYSSLGSFPDEIVNDQVTQAGKTHVGALPPPHPPSGVSLVSTA